MAALWDWWKALDFFRPLSYQANKGGYSGTPYGHLESSYHGISYRIILSCINSLVSSGIIFSRIAPSCIISQLSGGSRCVSKVILWVNDISWKHVGHQIFLPQWRQHETWMLWSPATIPIENSKVSIVGASTAQFRLNQIKCFCGHVGLLGYVDNAQQHCKPRMSISLKALVSKEK